MKIPNEMESYGQLIQFSQAGLLDTLTFQPYIINASWIGLKYV